MIKDLILSFIGYNICFINANWIFSRVTNNKYKIDFKKIVFSLGCSLFSTLLIIFKLNVINMFFSILVIILFNYIFYRNSLKKTSFISIFLWLFGLLLDMFMSIIYKLIIPLKVLDILYVQFFASIVLQFLENLIFLLKINIRLVNKLYLVFQKIGSYFLFVILIFGIYFDVNLFVFSNTEYSVKIFCIFILISIFIYFKIKNLYLDKFNREFCLFLEKNNRYNVNNIEGYRIFKHNLIHSLQSIKSYSSGKSLDLINQLMSEIYDLSIMNKELDNIPVGLNGLIYQKIASIESFKCNFYVINEFKYDILDVVDHKDYYAACKIVGVLVDNAIEAVMGIKNLNNRYLYIIFYDNDSNIEVQVCNSFVGCIDLDKLGDIRYSSKSSKRGLGLYSILENRKLSTNVFVNNGLFISTINIPKKYIY